MVIINCYFTIMKTSQLMSNNRQKGRIKKTLAVFLCGFVFALLCFVLINLAMEPVSTSQYCGSKCHEMNTAYKSWKLSPHGANEFGFRVECVDCHLPPKENFFRHLTAKVHAGAKDIYMHKFGPDYDVEKLRSKVLDHISNQTCLHCHDDLLAKPPNSAAREEHTAVLDKPEAPENRCVECHEDIGHQRES